MDDPTGQDVIGLQSVDAPIFSSFMRLSKIAARLADDLREPDAQHVRRVASDLCQFMRDLLGADVAFCRTVRADGMMELVSDVAWARGVDPVGEVPKRKHRHDGPCNPDEISSGERTDLMNDLARARDIYSEEELAFLDWLKSEACVPVIIKGRTVAIMILGKGEPGYFTSERLTALRACEGFVRAFYLSAEFMDDRAQKTDLLGKIGAALPLMMSASTPTAFYRAVCALLTCEHGFRFDRAMLFITKEGRLPAECCMAVGGTGGDWGNQQRAIENRFRSLRAYIEDALEFPIPGEGVPKKLGEPKQRDPLYEQACVKPLFYREGDSKRIDELLSPSGGVHIVVPKVDNYDPWITKINKERPGTFCSPDTGEYFFLPLLPLDKDDPIGFVLADMAHHGQHEPASGFPDLGIAALVLRLLAQMWQVQHDEQSYLHWLSAIPTLRHNAPKLGLDMAEFEIAIREREAWETLEKRLESVIARTKELEKATAVIERAQTDLLHDPVMDIGATMRELCQRQMARHEPFVHCECKVDTTWGAVAIPKRFLENIFDCLVANAVSAARTAGQEFLNLTVTISDIPLPEHESVGTRLLVLVANDGPAIAESLAPYLFVDRVSTHTDQHRGAGLSSARLQAKAFNGEIVLLSRDPVKFGIVLEPFPVEDGSKT